MIAYHNHIIAVTVRSRTKRTTSVVLFFNLQESCDIGYYLIPVNVNNLNSTKVECCTNQEGNIFIISVLENHYDQFELHFHALKCMSENTMQHYDDFRFDQPCWYEPQIHLSFMSSSHDEIIAHGEFPNSITQRGNVQCLVRYNLTSKAVEQAVQINDQLYPQSVSCSPDKQWLALLCRQSSDNWCSNVDCYKVQLYSSDNLLLRLEIDTAFSLNGYYSFSNCSRIVFSAGSELLAVASSSWSECWNTGEFEVLVPSKKPEQMQMTVYRVPSANLNLKYLCRDIILKSCHIREAYQLPLPNAMVDYLQYN